MMLLKIKLSLTIFPCEDMSKLCSTEEDEGDSGEIFSAGSGVLSHHGSRGAGGLRSISSSKSRV